MQCQCHITISIELQRIIAEINHHLACHIAALSGARSSDETDAPALWHLSRWKLSSRKILCAATNIPWFLWTVSRQFPPVLLLLLFSKPQYRDRINSFKTKLLFIQKRIICEYVDRYILYVKEHGQYLGQTLVSYSLETTEIASINGSCQSGCR